MGRPSRWNSPTTAIRVPEHLAEQLLGIARQLDSVQNSKALLPPPPCLITLGQGTGERRYLLAPPAISAEESEAIDRAIEDMFSGLGESELAIVFARLVEEVLEPVNE